LALSPCPPCCYPSKRTSWLLDALSHLPNPAPTVLLFSFNRYIVMCFNLVCPQPDCPTPPKVNPSSVPRGGPRYPFPLTLIVQENDGLRPDRSRVSGHVFSPTNPPFLAPWCFHPWHFPIRLQKRLPGDEQAHVISSNFIAPPQPASTFSRPFFFFFGFDFFYEPLWKDPGQGTQHCFLLVFRVNRSIFLTLSPGVVPSLVRCEMVDLRSPTIDVSPQRCCVDLAFSPPRWIRFMANPPFFSFTLAALQNVLDPYSFFPFLFSFPHP